MTLDVVQEVSAFRHSGLCAPCGEAPRSRSGSQVTDGFLGWPFALMIAGLTVFFRRRVPTACSRSLKKNDRSLPIVAETEQTLNR